MLMESLGIEFKAGIHSTDEILGPVNRKVVTFPITFKNDIDNARDKVAVQISLADIRDESGVNNMLFIIHGDYETRVEGNVVYVTCRITLGGEGTSLRGISYFCAASLR